MHVYCCVSLGHWFDSDFFIVFFPLLLHGVFEVLSTPLQNNQFEPSFSPSTSSTLHKYHNCQCGCLVWGLEVSSCSFGGGVVRSGHWDFYTPSPCLRKFLRGFFYVANILRPLLGSVPPPTTHRNALTNTVTRIYRYHTYLTHHMRTSDLEKTKSMISPALSAQLSKTP